MKDRTDQFLLIAFVLTLAAYLVMFAAFFSQFPISASPLLQFLILYFHAIPMVEAAPLSAHACGRAGLFAYRRMAYSGLDSCLVVVRRPGGGVRAGLGGLRAV